MATTIASGLELRRLLLAASNKKRTSPTTTSDDDADAGHWDALTVVLTSHLDVADLIAALEECVRHVTRIKLVPLYDAEGPQWTDSSDASRRRRYEDLMTCIGQRPGLARLEVSHVGRFPVALLDRVMRRCSTTLTSLCLVRATLCGTGTEFQDWLRTLQGMSLVETVEWSQVRLQRVTMRGGWPQLQPHYEWISLDDPAIVQALAQLSHLQRLVLIQTADITASGDADEESTQSEHHKSSSHLSLAPLLASNHRLQHVHLTGVTLNEHAMEALALSWNGRSSIKSLALGTITNVGSGINSAWTRLVSNSTDENHNAVGELELHVSSTTNAAVEDWLVELAQALAGNETLTVLRVLVIVDNNDDDEQQQQQDHDLWTPRVVQAFCHTLQANNATLHTLEITTRHSNDVVTRNETTRRVRPSQNTAHPLLDFLLRLNRHGRKQLLRATDTTTSEAESSVSVKQPLADWIQVISRCNGGSYGDYHGDEEEERLNFDCLYLFVRSCPLLWHDAPNQPRYQFHIMPELNLDDANTLDDEDGEAADNNYDDTATTENLWIHAMQAHQTLQLQEVQTKHQEDLAATKAYYRAQLRATQEQHQRELSLRQSQQEAQVQALQQELEALREQILAQRIQLNTKGSNCMTTSTPRTSLDDAPLLPLTTTVSPIRSSLRKLDHTMMSPATVSADLYNSSNSSQEEG